MKNVWMRARLMYTRSKTGRPCQPESTAALNVVRALNRARKGQLTTVPANNAQIF